MSEGKDVNTWLRTIDESQNVERLQDLGLPLISRLRHFLSRIITPTAAVGHYSPDTGKYVLGPFGYYTPGVSFTTASAAALTLTCPAGYRYRVYWGSAINVTQASTVNLSCTIGGNTPAIPLAVSNNSQVQHNVCIGTAGTFVVNKNVLPYLWLNAGDTATMTNNTYAAGNDTEHIFLYEAYRV